MFPLPTQTTLSPEFMFLIAALDQLSPFKCNVSFFFNVDTYFKRIVIKYASATS